MERERQVGVFRERIEAEPADIRDRTFARCPDRAGHDRDAIPASVSAPIEIEAAGVLERLTTREERAQVADFRVTRNRPDLRVGERPDQIFQRIRLHMRIGIEESDEAVTRGVQSAT